MTTQSKLADPLTPMSPDFLQNPYPTLDKVRAECPVLWSEKGKYWLVTRFAEGNSILRDLHYEKEGMKPPMTISLLLHLIPGASELTNSVGHWMLRKDPPDHTRLRTLVNKAFTPSTVKELRPRIQELTDQLLDEAAAKGEIELVSEFAFVLPVTVIAELLGIPAKDRDLFHRWSKTLTEILEPRPSINPQRLTKASAANHEMIEYLRPLVAERRKAPKDDLLSALVAAEQEGSKLTEEELLSNCVLMLVAGHETTVNLIGNGVKALLQHPDQLKLLQDDPSLIVNAVEEFLRYDSPVQIVRRIASEDMELGGQKIKKDQMLVIVLGGCNRDPEVYAEPNKFDITRKDIKHLSFGQGIHHCLGATLARAEAEIAISTLVKRFPAMRLKTDELEIKEPFALRGVKSMPISLTGK